ncbi:MAG: heavy metal translocating P-type ATPase metal-binding domain-containing protein [Bacteroidota bacterium]
MTTNILTPTTVCCSHCGDVCPPDPPMELEKAFCCEGCKTVYLLLSEHDLSQYYLLEEKPGISQKRSTQRENFAFLDLADIREQLIDFQDKNRIHIRLSLPQIHCTSCIWLLENLQRLHAGVQSCRVDFLKREAQIVISEDTISLRELAELLDRIGYPPIFRLDDLGEKQGKKGKQTLIYQLAVAGFCFGNIMLLSFPEYLGLTAEAGLSFGHFFSWLNLLLILPVLLYSSSPFFRSAWLGLREKHLNIDFPISLGIVVLFAQSLADILLQSGPGYLDSLAGLVFFLLVGKWFQQKTYDQLAFDRDYSAYFPIAATRLLEDGEEQVAVSKITSGDRLFIHHQEVIPCDAILRKGNAEIDYRFVSGESEPTTKYPGDLLYAGGRQMGGAIEIEVRKAVSQSYLTQLWNHESFQQEKGNAVQALADRLSQWFTPLILGIAVVSGIVWWWFTDISQAIRVMTAVLIVACPCGIALSAPVVLGSATRILGRMGCYLRDSGILENMATLNQIVFDKTGTLTHLDHKSEVKWIGKFLTDDKSIIQALAAQSLHPISKAIRMGAPRGPEARYVTEIKGMGLSGWVADKHVRIGKWIFIGGDHAHQRPGTWVSIDGKILGEIQIRDHYRPGMQETISLLGQQYELALLSGDQDRERQYLTAVFPPDSSLCFSQSPADKLQFIQEAQARGKRLMMIGDGLNDAGALSQSDVGMSITDQSGSFSPACDVILDGKQFSQIPAILRFSQGSIQLVRAAFLISSLYNIVGISIAIQGWLSPLLAAILMPLSSISVVIFSLSSSWLLGKKHFRSANNQLQE